MSTDDIAGSGPVTSRMVEKEPFGPMERLDHDRLRGRAAGDPRSPRRRTSLSARALFAFMDLAYGKPRTLEKFRVLELVARVPYQAWENVAYVAVTHTARQPGFARRVFDRVRVSRWEQDNEQWHLLILEEMLTAGHDGAGRRARRNRDRSRRSWPSSTTSCRGSRTRSTRRGPTASTPTSRTTPSTSTRCSSSEHPEWEHTPFVSESPRRLRPLRLARRPVPPDRLRRAPAQAAERSGDETPPLPLTQRSGHSELERRSGHLVLDMRLSR